MARIVDPRATHLRRLRRTRRAARRWGVIAAGLTGAAAVLTPYAGLGIPDAFWAAGAGSTLLLALFRWRDYRQVAALPLPPPAPPVERRTDVVNLLTAALREHPLGRAASDQLTRTRSRVRFRNSSAAPALRRMDRASRTLDGLASRLDGPVGGAVTEARGAEVALRDLAERALSMDRALEFAPADLVSPLTDARASMLDQLNEGASSYERLVAAAAECVAEDGRLGEQAAITRLTEATEMLRGFARGLIELRDFRTADLTAPPGGGTA